MADISFKPKYVLTLLFFAEPRRPTQHVQALANTVGERSDGNGRGFESLLPDFPAYMHSLYGAVLTFAVLIRLVTTA